MLVNTPILEAYVHIDSIGELYRLEDWKSNKKRKLSLEQIIQSR